MSRVEDICGKRYGKLTVRSVDKDRTTKKHTYWFCECDCGNVVSVRADCLKSGTTKSCKCLWTAEESHHKKHGMSSTKLYHVFYAMLQRCENEKDKRYRDYGERGIRVCDEWKANPESFLKWAMENGYKEGLTIERVDNNKGYSPENCKWITIAERQKNKRPRGNMDILLEYNGKRVNLMQLSTLVGMNYHTLYFRYKRGLRLPELITPIKKV